MGGPQSLSSTSRSLRITSKKYWNAEIRPNKVIIAQLILLTTATGIQDALTYIDYHCLHSAQTGNTVLLSVATSYNTANYRPLVANAASSLIAFSIGSFLTGQSGALIGHRARAWQFGIGMLQTCMIIGAIYLICVHGIRERGLWTCMSLVLLAGQCGSQIAAARAWDVPEITTGMATAAWVDLTRDGRLWALHNRSRNLRVAFFLALFSGCGIGALLRQTLGPVKALVVAIVLKVVAHGSVLFAPAKEDGEDGEDADVLQDGDTIPL